MKGIGKFGCYWQKWISTETGCYKGKWISIEAWLLF
jgi:hypothetical protein